MDQGFGGGVDGKELESAIAIALGSKCRLDGGAQIGPGGPVFRS